MRLRRFLITLGCLSMMCGSFAQMTDPLATPNLESSKRAAWELFPDSAVEGSRLFLKVVELQRERRLVPGFLDNPDWPLVVKREATASLGIKPIQRVAIAWAEAGEFDRLAAIAKDLDLDKEPSWRQLAAAADQGSGVREIAFFDSGVVANLARGKEFVFFDFVTPR